MAREDADEETMRMHNGPTRGPLSAARAFVSEIRETEDSDE